MSRTANPRWGAHLSDAGARFRLWAPAQTAVSVRVRGGDIPMRRSDYGCFTCTVADLIAGDVYAFVLEDGSTVADPAARAGCGCAR